MRRTKSPLYNTIVEIAFLLAFFAKIPYNTPVLNYSHSLRHPKNQPAPKRGT